ncbi:BgTH12-00753 [Blumeria graminis f. sp. triticale]|uniref:Bgt-4296 n=3 Tax=Blumeria graminis TaxID=34373 RepID=A0A381LG83_BLUGR|nr:Mitochondrial inner membrane protein [Blumeria graminis f. sp. tritici 96224]CAD6505261.1 BgTH12-00753 [Blumeria graminis f. sp. triticale]VDB93271.1 Bgt-4296 [Blumeria graminis f. sp. tritici]
MSTARVARNAVQSPLLHALTFTRTGPSFRYAAYSRKICPRSSPHTSAFLGLQTIGRLSNSSRMSTNKPVEQGKTSNNGHETNPTRQNTESPLLNEKDIEKVYNDRTTSDSKLDNKEGTSTTGLDEKGIDDEKEVKKIESKLTLMQKVKKEAQHYWDGTKLLATEVKISTKLAVKMAAGYELSRRENRQLQRTVQDIVRLVPFSVFILVPFAELLLPVALKLFPNMLPSTYEGQKSKDTKVTTLRATRKEVSNFLRDTLKESGLPLSPATTQRDEFTQFFRKLRATGEYPSPTEVINVCKIFKDDLTLDNLSRPQLVGMCRYMNLNTFGTDMMLRYQIRHRMRQIKRDDRAISFEGVDSLSIPELQVACMSRGLRTHGASPGRLRDDLQSWLDLRLQHGVPSTLLVLSNAFVYAQGKSDSEFHSQIDALTGVLSSIPEELFHEMELEIHSAEGAATNKQRLEVLKEQQDLIEEENEQDEENKETGRASPRDDENIDEKEERRVIAEAADQLKAQNAVEGKLTPEKVEKMSENK